MKDREELVNYTAENGKKVRVVTGRTSRKGAQRNFNDYSTVVYAGGREIARYPREVLPETSMSSIREVLSQAQEGRSNPDELLAAIDNRLSVLGDLEDIEEADAGDLCDDPISRIYTP